jgi:hypothetical protein
MGEELLLMHNANGSSTERAQVELLLSHPEIIAWLGLNEAEVARLERQEHNGSSRAAFVVDRFENASDGSSRAVFVVDRFENAPELSGSDD